MGCTWSAGVCTCLGGVPGPGGIPGPGGCTCPGGVPGQVLPPEDRHTPVKT